MVTPKIILAQPLNDYKIRLKFADGVSGEVDLSHLAGKGVFVSWGKHGNYKKVSIEAGRWLVWPGDIDIDADSLYLKLTGKSPEELFPSLMEDPAHA